MTDWTSGYVADIGYTYGYYLELNPQRVKLAFLNAGLVAPEFGTACELGFGQGRAVGRRDRLVGPVVDRVAVGGGQPGFDLAPIEAHHPLGLHRLVQALARVVRAIVDHPLQVGGQHFAIEGFHRRGRALARRVLAQAAACGAKG